MRVAVIRGDLPNSLFINDLEPSSNSNSQNPRGQTRYLSRPSVAAITTYLASQGLVANASNLVLATVPVGGPVDVSPATIKGVTGLTGATNAQVTAIQDLLAPRFIETTIARASWLEGNLKGYRNASFSPDPNRFSTGAAVVVVQDDGVTLYALVPKGGFGPSVFRSDPHLPPAAKTNEDQHDDQSTNRQAGSPYTRPLLRSLPANRRCYSHRHIT